MNQKINQALKVQLTKEQESNLLQEGAYRRLLQEHELALQYDSRIERSHHLAMSVKYSLYDGRDSQLIEKPGKLGGTTLIVEVIDLLDYLKRLDHEIKERKRENGLFLVANLSSKQAEVPYSQENYDFLMSES